MSESDVSRVSGTVRGDCVSESPGSMQWRLHGGKRCDCGKAGFTRAVTDWVTFGALLV